MKNKAQIIKNAAGLRILRPPKTGFTYRMVTGDGVKELFLADVNLPDLVLDQQRPGRTGESCRRR